ncbi:uncharacterized protein LOC134712202 [Mytilus trossulus]|uniref:uncharacterized protein LOC134712202 n=1 Tax=Mytilus trossulus TaxID=6551 RepID=UPI003007A3C6
MAYSNQCGFLRNLVRNKCQIEQKELETVAIESAVKELIHKILRSVETEYPCFKISKIVPSGSFYEKTKIGNLDEFDYMIVLHALSGDDIELHDGCNPWYKRIELKDGNHCFKIYCCSVHYENTPKFIVSEFWKNVSKLQKLSKLSVEIPQRILTHEENESDKLLFTYVKKTGISEPTSQDKDRWLMVPIKRMHIGIDLMMSIDHPCLESVAKCEGFPSEYKELLMKLGCHIVIKSCHTQHFPEPTCYFISFAALELELMKNLDEHHKKCYKILKCLLTGEMNFKGKCMNLSSYVLKTAFLFHVYGSKGCTYSILDAKCINKVLDYLSSCFHNLRMPCFFARDMNTWGHILEFPIHSWTGWDFYDSRRFAFCYLWVKLWYQIVHFVKTAISVENIPDMSEWYTITDKCEYMKSTIYYLLEKYTDWHNTDVQTGVVTNEELKGKNLTSCSDEQFSDFVKKLQKLYNINLNFLL